MKDIKSNRAAKDHSALFQRLPVAVFAISMVKIPVRVEVVSSILPGNFIELPITI